jgi:hypothetical protein
MDESASSPLSLFGEDKKKKKKKQEDDIIERLIK